MISSQAFIIGWTSEFVPKMVYFWRTDTLAGYVNSSLSRFATDNFIIGTGPDQQNLKTDVFGDVTECR